MAEIFVRDQVGLMAYSPLAQGFLSGKYLNGARPPGASISACTSPMPVIRRRVRCTPDTWRW